MVALGARGCAAFVALASEIVIVGTVLFVLFLAIMITMITSVDTSIYKTHWALVLVRKYGKYGGT